MKTVFSRVAIALLSMTAIFSSSTFASIIVDDFSVLGAQNNPGQIAWNFNAASGAANLAFELAGYRSLDGYNNCCTDTFHLLFNGSEIFTGSFNMGGGGSNNILFNPNGGTALVTTFGATGDVHNSHQVTWLGGKTQISLPINLMAGANKIYFKYTGLSQGAADESWGVNLATITPVTSLPESSSYVLFIIGLLGIITLRRRNI
jgi:hypothetical protein